MLNEDTQLVKAWLLEMWFFEVPVCSLLLVFLWGYNRFKINVGLKHRKSKPNTIKTFFIEQSLPPSLPSPDNFRKSGHF